MNTHKCALAGAALLPLMSTTCANCFAQTNVAPAHKFAWGEYIGWTNWRDANGMAQGVRVAPSHMAGYIWCENAGWVNTGNGGGPYPVPASQTGVAFGVNIDTMTGELAGYAWGENIGWINFGTTPSIGVDGARYDSAAGRLRGWAWGENIGWINLDDSMHFICARPPDVNGSGSVEFADILVVLANFGSVGPLGDADGNGVVNFNDILTVLANFGAACP